MDEPRFFNPWGEIAQTKTLLPHWQQPGATYFVTFHMADSVPLELRRQWAEERTAWLRAHPEPWDAATESEYHKRFSGALERWLDAGHGSCYLRRPDAARIVAGALAHFEGDRYVQHAWVVMPNHVHAVVSLHPDHELEAVLHSWKSFTSHRLVTMPEAPNPFWQRDSFDRLVRDQKHFANCVQYIRRNPEKANLQTAEFIHFEGEMARQIE